MPVPISSRQHRPMWQSGSYDEGGKVHNTQSMVQPRLRTNTFETASLSSEKIMKLPRCDLVVLVSLQVATRDDAHKKKKRRSEKLPATLVMTRLG